MSGAARLSMLRPPNSDWFHIFNPVLRHSSEPVQFFLYLRAGLSPGQPEQAIAPNADIRFNGWNGPPSRFQCCIHLLSLRS